MRTDGELSETLSQLAERYVAERSARGELTGQTPRVYRVDLGRFARDLDCLDRASVRDWYTQRALTTSPASTAARLARIRGFCRWLVEEGVIDEDPTKGLEYPRIPDRLPRNQEPQLVDALLASLPDSRARLIVLLMVQEGLRCAEVASLMLGDVNFGARTLRVMGKGSRERTLPITDECWSALRAYLDDEPPPAAGSPLIRSRNRPHRPLTAHYVSRQVSYWMREAGVKRYSRDGVSAHALRHTCAVDVLEESGDVKAVQDMLGHRSLATTMVYTRVTRASKLRSVMEGRRYRVGDVIDLRDRIEDELARARGPTAEAAPLEAAPGCLPIPSSTDER